MLIYKVVTKFQMRTLIVLCPLKHFLKTEQ